MMFGIGVDILEVGRIDRFIEKYGDKFLSRIFSDCEVVLGCADGDRFYRARYFAKRFAAKEACIKSIGGRFGVSMKNIEILNDDVGKPTLRLNGSNDSVDLSFFLSMSDERDYVVAMVVSYANCYILV